MKVVRTPIGPDARPPARRTVEERLIVRWPARNDRAALRSASSEADNDRVYGPVLYHRVAGHRLSGSWDP
jgi:hypothetical protein